MKRKSIIPSIGRKVTSDDWAYMDWCLSECFIDKISGLGLRARVLGGHYCPRPHRENGTVNRMLCRWGVPRLPVTLFAAGRSGITPVFFYSDISAFRLVINLDFDNKYKLDWTEFQKQRDILLAGLGLSQSYTQRSTNGNGTHSYITLKIDDQFVGSSCGDINFESLATRTRSLILDFQKAARRKIQSLGLQIHLDVMGLPAIYDNLTKQLKLRGSWVKLPFDMEIPNERLAFESRQIVSATWLQDLVLNIECEDKIDSKVKKKPPVSNDNLQTYGSTETRSRWDLADAIRRFFVFRFGTKSFPWRCRGVLTDKEFADYVINIEHASRVSTNKKHEKEIWIGTLPERLVKAIYETNRESGRNLQTNCFDPKKYKFVRECLVNLELISIIDRRWFPIIVLESGIVLREGIAAKWHINEQFYSFFQIQRISDDGHDHHEEDIIIGSTLGNLNKSSFCLGCSNSFFAQQFIINIHIFDIELEKFLKLNLLL